MMPPISIWMIRLALTWLAFGVTIGLSLMAARLPDVTLPSLFAWQPPHGAIMMIGWMLQLAMGVGYWMLPRYITPEGDHKRGSETAMIACAIGLNAAVLGFLLDPLTSLSLPRISYLLLLLSVLIFAGIHLKRIRNQVIKN
jgi:heme/copper-type cytochrome/quinol oxidase subunit 1